MAQEVWVFTEKTNLLPELLGGAQQAAAGLGASVAAVVAGPRSAAEEAAGNGASTVYWLGDLAGRMVEDYVPTLAQLVKDRQPAALFIGATKRGKAVAGRLAARLDASAVTDVKELAVEDGALKARHLVFGGGAVRWEKSATPTFIATVGAGVFEPTAAGGAGEVVEVPFVEPEWKLEVKERKSRGVSSVNLAAAKRVVCPGRGIAQKEDLEMVFELARLLEAEVGATRPLTEGLDWLPRERYIGVSGQTIKPDLYLCMGVSGQVQHTVGINDSRVIVAIDKDKTAPIFEQADYGIVEDLYKVVPLLIEALKARK